MSAKLEICRWLTLTGLVSFVGSCSSQDKSEYHGGSSSLSAVVAPLVPTDTPAPPAPAPAAAPRVPGNVGVDRSDQTKVTEAIDTSGFSLQVKDVTLLRNSIVSCMGPGMLGITAAMILPANQTTVTTAPDGTFPFLLPGTYTVGQDIINVESVNLVDLSTGVRTTVVADSLTDTYLRSLENIANVVAANCTASNTYCTCATSAQAQAMLARCLPGLDPKSQSMSNTAGLLSTICAAGPAGMRQVVASLMASEAFASAR